MFKGLPVVELCWFWLHLKKNLLWRFIVKAKFISIILLLSESILKGTIRQYYNLKNKKKEFLTCNPSSTKKTPIKSSLPKNPSQSLCLHPLTLFISLSPIWNPLISPFQFKLLPLFKRLHPFQFPLSPASLLNAKVLLSYPTLEKHFLTTELLRIAWMQTLKLSWPPKLQKIINCARKEAEVEKIRSPKTEKTLKINLGNKNITTFIAKPSYAHFMIKDNAKSTLLNATSHMALKN